MDKLYFTGTVISGCGQYSELEFPDKIKIEGASEDWPQSLLRGSLNIRINEDGYPEEFSRLGYQNNIKMLDKIGFQPEFIIPGQLIKNNKLLPTPEYPNRGSVQVWRAVLTNKHSEEYIHCWVVRRFGSGLFRDIELVSDTCLRKKLKLENENNVVVCMFGQWEKR
jgi:hypothetical protein